VGIAKKIIWWDFERASWQWDVLCLVIVAFIFLTPKAWFEKKERLATRPDKIIVQAQGLSPDRETLERKVRELTRNEQTEVVEFAEKKDSSGSVFYEITIR
jgi:hypothetical protein